MQSETDARNQAEIDQLDMDTLERMTRPTHPDNVAARDRQMLEPTRVPQSCVAGHNGRLYPAIDTPLARCPTNLPLDTREGKALLLAAGNPGDLDLSDNIRDGQGRRYIVVEAVYYVIYPDTAIDPETGVESTFARTVLIRRDGKTFRTSSAHVPHKIAAALDLYTPEEWRDGIPFRITERPSKNTKRGNYHDIRVEC